MSGDEKVIVTTEKHEDNESYVVSLSKKQQKRLFKSQRLKETKPQWRYRLYAPALKVNISNVGQNNELKKKKRRESAN